MGYNSTTKQLLVDYPSAGTAISIDDIRRAVNSTSQDLGTLCKASGINIFSCQKPMRINEIGIPTAAQKKSVNYGYVFPGCTQVETTGMTLAELINLEVFGVKPSWWPNYAADANYQPLLNEWYYAKPRGMSYNEHFRALDFDGYKHDVVNSLIDTEITSRFTRGQSQTFFADLYQQQNTVMANFWQDTSHTRPMALTGMAYHAFGIVIVPSNATQSQATDPNNGGRYCKYHVWPSPVKQTNPQIASADSYFTAGDRNYYVIPFIYGRNSAISEQDNLGGYTLALSPVIPLPCAFTTCVVSSEPDPTESFSIYGTPMYAQNVPNVDFSWQIAYSSGLQGASVNYTIDEMDGNTIVRSWTGTTALSTASGAYPRRASDSRSIRMTLSGYTYRLTISYSTYPSVTKTFREQITPVE